MSKPWRLFWRLYPSYLLITLLALLAMSIYVSMTLKTFFMDQVSSGLEARALLIKDQFIQHLNPLNTDEIDRLCKMSGKQAGTRVTVILPSGVVAGDTDENPQNMDNHGQRSEIREAYHGRTRTSIRYSATLQQNMMYVAVPLKMGTKLLAVVRTSVPIGEIDRQIERIRGQNAAMGILIALLATGISLIVSRRISAPIEAMRQGVEQYAAGNFKYRLSMPKTIEMIHLARAMNQMAEDLDGRMQTVMRQRNELEAVLSSMQEGVIALDVDERVIKINESAARMFQCNPHKVLGRSIQETIRNARLFEFVSTASSENGPVQSEIIFFHEEELSINVHGYPLCDADGKRLGTLIVFHDITQIRRLENIRRDFVANVSHELKTPLTAIKGYVETLRVEALNKPEEALRFLEVIENHTDRLTTIIEDLIELSEIEQKNDYNAIPLEQRHIKEIIEAAAGICASKAEEKKIGFEIVCGDGLMAAVNPRLFEQALVNLLDNAVKYGQEGSQTTIHARETDKEVVIAVRDHGIGIARSHLPRIFERFYRVDKARSRKEGGTGLGLSIVKHIVQAHGGYVSVESTPGQGSTFEIHLPASGQRQGE
jgi:two-component system phosphate regulon sensor histidine kinase PhoR